MTIGILGLGLIGGSLAYALNGFMHGDEAARIVGFDPDPLTQRMALDRGAVHAIASSPEEAVCDADLVIYSSSPHTIMQNMRRTFPLLKDNCVVTEICGVKREMVQFVSSALPDGATYVGLHPMAGKEVGGFTNADGRLFSGAGFIIVPIHDEPEQSDRETLAIALLKSLCVHIGAGRIVVNTPDTHDSIIAYTSDLMHISASALCDDFMPEMTLAHTAGAFRDCTRVARIDANLWTELLLGNREYILPHLHRYIDILSQYANALEQSSPEPLRELLARSSRNKMDILGR